MKKHCSLLLFAGLLLCPADPAPAAEALFYREINLVGGYSERRDWVAAGLGQRNSIGFEYYKKLANDYGDFLTVDLQVRLGYDENEPFRDAWSLEIHNAWAEYKASLRYKILAGHFAPAFGRELIQDTHVTLTQTLAKKNIGFKKDWGLGLRTYAGDYDLVFGVQLGSGMSIRRQSGSYLVTGRLSSATAGSFQYGLSGMAGQVLRTMGMSTIPRNDLISPEAVEKIRAGLDGELIYGPLGINSEVVYGTNDGTRVLGAWTQVDYTVPGRQNWQNHLTVQYWVNDLSTSSSEDVTALASITYQINSDITIRAGFQHDFQLWNGLEDSTFIMQIYYFAR